MQPFCLDSVPNFLGIFDFSIAPALLFYSYVPILILSLFFGIFVIVKNKNSTQSILFFLIVLFFSLFLINEIVQWIAVPASLVFYAWSLAPLFQICVWIFTIYFFYNFLYEKKLSLGLSFVLFSFSLPILFFLPTRLNIANFDLLNCEGKIGWLWYYLYIFQIVSIVFLLFLGLIKIYNEKKINKVLDRRSLIFILGVSFFLFSFFFSNVFGEIYQAYQVNLLGPIGMVIFLGLLTYLIVKYKAFNIKLLGAQAIIAALLVLIASQLAFIQNPTNRILTGITLTLATIFGWQLIKSVKKEISQKEELIIANEKLKKLDQAKSEFISIASHQLRTPLTVIKGYLSMVIEGNFGVVPFSIKDALSKVNISNERLIQLVEDLLNISRIESGRLLFTWEKKQLEDLVASVCEELAAHATKKNLKFEFVRPTTKLPLVKMDEEKLRQVVMNLVDNSIKYTSKGSITVSLKKLEEKILFCVSDSGIGVNTDDMPNLFKKFSRGTGTSLIHTEGTGLGLYVVKQLIELHGGRAWVESAGEGKGSKFYFEIPFIK